MRRSLFNAEVRANDPGAETKPRLPGGLSLCMVRNIVAGGFSGFSAVSTGACERDLALLRPSSPWQIIWLDWFTNVSLRRKLRRKGHRALRRKIPTPTHQMAQKGSFAHSISNSFSINSFHTQFLESEVYVFFCLWQGCDRYRQSSMLWVSGRL
jgi:hypothetical protein